MAPARKFPVRDVQEFGSSQASWFLFLFSSIVIVVSVLICGCCRKGKKDVAKEEGKEETADPGKIASVDVQTPSAKTATPGKSSAEGHKKQREGKDYDDDSVIVAAEQLSVRTPHLAKSGDIDDLDLGLSTHHSIRNKDISVRTKLPHLVSPRIPKKSAPTKRSTKPRP